MVLRKITLFDSLKLRTSLFGECCPELESDDLTRLFVLHNCLLISISCCLRRRLLIFELVYLQIGLTMFWLFYLNRVVVYLCRWVSDVMAACRSCEIPIVVALNGSIVFDAFPLLYQIA